MSMLDSEVQPLKVPSLITFKFSGRVIVSKEEHLENAYSSIEVTLSGIVRDSRLVQLAKAYAPMDCTESGIFTVVRL